MKDGGYLRFDRIDFGQGANGIRAFVSSENAKLHGGVLEFRLDGQAGELLGTIAVAPTSGVSDYKLLTAGSKAVSGVHNVFLIAHGNGGDAEGHLFNVAWFTFTR